MTYQADVFLLIAFLISKGYRRARGMASTSWWEARRRREFQAQRIACQVVRVFRAPKTPSFCSHLMTHSCRDCGQINPSSRSICNSCAHKAMLARAPPYAAHVCIPLSESDPDAATQMLESSMCASGHKSRRHSLRGLLHQVKARQG